MNEFAERSTSPRLIGLLFGPAYRVYFLLFLFSLFFIHLFKFRFLRTRRSETMLVISAAGDAEMSPWKMLNETEVVVKVKLNTAVDAI